MIFVDMHMFSLCVVIVLMTENISIREHVITSTFFKCHCLDCELLNSHLNFVVIPQCVPDKIPECALLCIDTGP